MAGTSNIIKEMKILAVKISKRKASVPMFLDDGDFEILKDFRFHLNSVGYPQFCVEGHVFPVHRLLAGNPSKKQVDHRDGNPLNNRRGNLRVCSKSENMQNRGKQKNNTSGFKGVTWSRNDKRWVAGIWKDKKRFHLGYFTSPAAAHEAYKNAAKDLHGEFANVGQP